MHSGSRVAVIALITAVLASGQFAALQRQPEPVANPSSKPLPRRFVGVHPETIYSGLLSSSAEQRKVALQDLGDKYTDANEPIAASLRGVNLDSDAELEYVLVANAKFPPESTAYVFDKDERGWWVIGEFSYGWHWDANVAERLVELREIVRRGRKEIMVRETSGGSDLLRVTDLSIYRMNNGALYRTFEATEYRSGRVIGTNMTGYEHRDFEFPDPRKDGNVFLVSRYQKRTEYAEHSRPDRKIARCTAFRWDPMAFLFTEDKTAAKTQCAVR